MHVTLYSHDDTSGDPWVTTGTRDEMVVHAQLRALSRNSAGTQIVFVRSVSLVDWHPDTGGIVRVQGCNFTCSREFSEDMRLTPALPGAVRGTVPAPGHPWHGRKAGDTVEIPGRWPSRVESVFSPLPDMATASGRNKLRNMGVKVP